MNNNRIKIGSKRYNLFFSNINDPVFKEHDDVNGYIEYPLSEIKIRDDISYDTQKETIIHELLHALLENSGVTEKNLDETIKILTPRLHLFLEDNQDFINNFIDNKIKS